MPSTCSPKRHAASGPAPAPNPAAARRSCRQWLSDRAGNVAVEFALIAPILIALFLGTAELTRYVLAVQKMNRVASSVSDLVARADGISESALNDIFAAASSIADPFDFANDGRMIVSGIANPSGAGPVIAWQRVSPGNIVVQSEFGTEGGNADLGQGISLRLGETMIAVETFYDFDPVITNDYIAAQQVYTSAFNRPRIQSLDQITSD